MTYLRSLIEAIATRVSLTSGHTDHKYFCGPVKCGYLVRARRRNEFSSSRVLRFRSWSRQTSDTFSIVRPNSGESGYEISVSYTHLTLPTILLV